MVAQIFSRTGRIVRGKIPGVASDLGYLIASVVVIVLATGILTRLFEEQRNRAIDEVRVFQELPAHTAMAVVQLQRFQEEVYTAYGANLPILTAEKWRQASLHKVNIVLQFNRRGAIVLSRDRKKILGYAVDARAY